MRTRINTCMHVCVNTHMRTLYCISLVCYARKVGMKNNNESSY